MQICFFEDSLSGSLKPLTLTRPCDDLRAGILKIHAKWSLRLKSDSFTRILKPKMEGVFNAPEINEEDVCIWINGRFLPDPNVIKIIDSLIEDEGLVLQNIPVVVKMSGSRSARLFKAGNINTSDIDFEDIESGRLLTNPWSIFRVNAEEIEKDIELLPGLKRINPSEFEGVFFNNPTQIYCGKNVQIEPGTVLNASDGPVVLMDDSLVMAGCLVRGPFVLGEHSVLKMGAKVYGGSTIGPHCKIGGEINNVVFQGFSNKAHDGFLGNSVIGEWCNFGADTNNSNLKNNYSNVRVTDWETGKEVDTELQFCGLVMGDHSKTAINTVLNTGTVCGVSSNIFSGTFPPKLIKSFRWMGPKGEDIFKFDKAMEVAERMMKRRGLSPTPEYRAMMRFIFEKSNV